ncbi:MAG: tetratricopeptide repeat protein [Thermodesulfobacteriota bacterium]|nr:tetratricopeptide repeat protein [Thermodesulfobacteriota bacterium]
MMKMTRHICFFLCLFLMLSIISCQSNNQEDYKAGIDAVKQKNFDQAIESFTKAIDSGELSEKKLAQGYLFRGASWFEKGMYDNAIHDFTKVIDSKQLPKEVIWDTYNYRGICWAIKQKHDEAKKDYAKAIELEPKEARSYYLYGRACGFTGEYDTAIEYLTKSIELDPKNIENYHFRAKVWHQKGEHDRAIEDHTKAIELNPEGVESYYFRGRAWSDKGEYDRAIGDFNKAVELSPKHADIFLFRGNAWQRKGGYNRAMDDYNKAIDLAPNNPQNYNSLAWLLATCPDSKYRDGYRAVELAEKAVNLSRSEEKMFYKDTLAAAYAEVGRFYEAVSAQEEAVQFIDGKNSKAFEEFSERLELYRKNRPYRDK